MRTTIRSAGNKRPGGTLPTLYYFGVGRSGDAGKAYLGTRCADLGFRLPLTADLRRIPIRRTSEKNPSTHSAE
jgi:hypothetical protein